LCTDWRRIGPLLAAAEVVYAEHKNICVWEKTNASLHSFYRNRHAFVSVHMKGHATPHRNSIRRGRRRNRTDLWRYPGVRSSSRAGDAGNARASYPTAKPTALVADALLDASAPNELVLDCALGSGNTLMAAERVGRRCHGLERDPLYIDAIVRRWERETGDTARNAATGLSFAEAALKREGPAAVFHGR
jgi:DNA modification methylase